MTVYVTKKGERISADSGRELVEKLQRMRGFSTMSGDDFLKQIVAEMPPVSIVPIPQVDGEDFIAALIQNDYLQIVDSIDG